MTEDKMQVLFVVLCALFAASHGYFLECQQSADIKGVSHAPGLRTTFGTGDGAGTSYFFDIPRNVSAAEEFSWTQTARPDDAPLSSLVMYCPTPDFTVCAMYDDNDIVAGLQVALPASNFTNSVPSDLTTIGFVNWSPPDGNNYFVMTQFFVNEEYLTIDAATRLEEYDSTVTLQYDSVWVPNYNTGSLMLLNGTTETFTQQTCTASMGRHNYYNLSRTTSCDELLPWFTLTENDALVGTGFMVLGNLTVDEGRRNWFEHFSQSAVEYTAPDGPQCMFNFTTDPGMPTIHVYYEDDPTTIVCPSS